ncbi:MAG: SLC13 family permease [Calditrichaeota bacterium]|nr:SLC13 family permease [Calditrichota bacterium]
MSFEFWYTTIIIVLMSIALTKEFYKPALIVFTALLLLIIGNVVSIDEAFSGFSNKGMLTVGFLFIVSAALQSSGAFENIILQILGNGNTSTFVRYIRFLFPVAGLSAFLNNTPIVASLIPIVKSWTKKNNLTASKFLIPLSYAAILGGVTTLIGTSTNLIIHGMLLEHGYPGFSFFEITKIGLPVAILGLLFIALVGHRLLPSRKEPIVQLDENTREFVVEMKVGEEYPNIGKSIEQANLRHLQGLFLFQISRGIKIIAPVSPEEKIKLSDRLFFTGLPQTIYELQKTPGLHVIKDTDFDLENLDSDEIKTYEAVVSESSPLNGQTVRDSNFRNRYQAIILAIHRSGQRINKKVGDIVFRPGDTLFILAKKGFDKKWYHQKDFTLVSSSLDIYSKPKWKGNLALILLLGLVLSAALNLVPIILAAAATAVLMVALRILSPEDAQKSIDWSVLLVIASSFGIGRALENSGLSAIIADALVYIFDVLGPMGVIAAIFFITSGYTMIITNNAVAAIMFPVVLTTVKFLHTDMEPLMLAFVIGASACFASPLGYQTNYMVYGPGSYRFTDFLKIGLSLNLFLGVSVTALIYFMFYF